MDSKNASLDSSEATTRQLEASIETLKKNLRHWGTWDADYECLKEAIEAIPDPPTIESLARVREDYVGEVLVAKELDEIFGGGSSTLKPKSRSQVLNTLKGRISYVLRNVETLQAQLNKAEDELFQLACDIYADDHGIGATSNASVKGALPFTDIVEQLDEQDNVISHQLVRPSDTASQVQDMLNKVGVKLPDDITEKPAATASTSAAPKKQNIRPDEVPNQQPKPKLETATATTAPKPTASPATTAADTSKPKPATKQLKPKSPKKAVAFADDTKPVEQEEPARPSWAVQRVEQIMKTAQEQEESSKQPAILPQDEASEDAALRQQMLQYSMGEIGAVVAELEIEEGSEFDDDDDDDYEDDEDYDDDNGLYADDDDNGDDQEDKYGRSTQKMITKKLHNRMMELEKRLGVKSRFTQSPDNSDATQEDDPNQMLDRGVGRIRVKQGENNTATSVDRLITEIHPEPMRDSSNDTPGSKSVRFADSLDIAPAPEPSQLQKSIELPSRPRVDPIKDIVERAPRREAPASTTTGASGARTSRFKQARLDGTAGPPAAQDCFEAPVIPKGPLDAPREFLARDTRDVPTGPAGQTLATTIVERETASTSTDNANNDDDDDEDVHEFSATVLQHEVADEYHRLRSKFIKRQGGFLKEDEAQMQPLDEEDGGPKRMSRFMAARLSNQ